LARVCEKHLYLIMLAETASLLPGVADCGRENVGAQA
jgi:hypothetical protein